MVKILSARLPVTRGFSLVEVVVAIVIMSILSIGLVDFITDSADGYRRSALRNQVSASGRIVIDRIAMEMHNALPESVRIPTHPDTNGNHCIEFIPVRAATSYIDPAVRPAAFKTTFHVVDFVPSQIGATNVYAVIYPTSSTDLYSASFTGNTTEAISLVSVEQGDNPNTDKIRVSLPVTGHRFRRESSVDRLFLTAEPVSFCVVGNKLYRYSNYGFQAVQCSPSTPSCLPTITPKRVLISDQLNQSALRGANFSESQAFDMANVSRNRNAVIQLDLNFTQGGEQVRLNHEILLQSTP